MRDYYSTVRPDMHRYLPKHFTRVLEVGCSAGGFSSQLKSGQVEVWGIEPNPEAAAIAQTRLDRVICSTYDEASTQLPSNHFDLVICNDVIEHMPDHDWFLRDIQTKMAPGGHLVGSLPNVRHITALIKLLAMKDWPYRDEGILDRTHLRFFTKKSIERTLRDNGFEVEKLGGNSGVIRHGFVKMKQPSNNVLRLVTAAIVGATLGYYNDIQYPQFGFRARSQAV
jgi:2-polyprenyl-3-methyl-5-hydroxy-6-metoxy-1,4-benzoquinol methylase